MKRTTVYLAEDLDLELARLAKRQARSKAELIREALESFVTSKRERTAATPSWIGAGRSGAPDLAERAGEEFGKLLEEDYEQALAEWAESRKHEPPR